MPCRTHGMSGQAVYARWKGMHNRCSNPKHRSYKNYGGRGIYVCKRWSGPQGFDNFHDDMGQPGKGMTIDRIDNDGPYSPENCRWASRKTQVRNSRVVRLITIGDKTQCLTDWCKEYGLSIQIVCQRQQRGMTIEEAITTPLHAPRRKAKRLVVIDGKQVHLRDVLQKHGIKKATFYRRIERGWSLKAAATTWVRFRPFKPR